jgi:hypothetical protein
MSDAGFSTIRSPGLGGGPSPLNKGDFYRPYPDGRLSRVVRMQDAVTAVVRPARWYEYPLDWAEEARWRWSWEKIRLRGKWARLVRRLR